MHEEPRVIDSSKQCTELRIDLDGCHVALELPVVGSPREVVVSRVPGFRRIRERAAFGIEDDRGASWSGVALAHNVATNGEVDEIIERARSGGATVTREPADTFYGGYAGVFRDLDGHVWEIAHNPGFGLAEDGSVTLPDQPGTA